MKDTFVSPLMGVLLSVCTASASFAGTAAVSQREPQWCRVETAAQATPRRDRQTLLAALAKHRPAKPKLASVRKTERRPMFVRLEAPSRAAPAATPEPYGRELVASCASGHASILCPGYQLIGAEY